MSRDQRRLQHWPISDEYSNFAVACLTQTERVSDDVTCKIGPLDFTPTSKWNFENMILCLKHRKIMRNAPSKIFPPHCIVHRSSIPQDQTPLSFTICHNICHLGIFYSQQPYCICTTMYIFLSDISCWFIKPSVTICTTNSFSEILLSWTLKNT